MINLRAKYNYLTHQPIILLLANNNNFFDCCWFHCYYSNKVDPTWEFFWDEIKTLGLIIAISKSHISVSNLKVGINANPASQSFIYLTIRYYHIHHIIDVGEGLYLDNHNGLSDDFNLLSKPYGSQWNVGAYKLRGQIIPASRFRKDSLRYYSVWPISWAKRL